EHADRTRVDAEAHSGTFALLLLIGHRPPAATAATAASHDGDGHDGDAVDLRRFAEHALHRHHVLDRIEPRECVGDCRVVHRGLLTRLRLSLRLRGYERATRVRSPKPAAMRSPGAA